MSTHVLTPPASAGRLPRPSTGYAAVRLQRRTWLRQVAVALCAATIVSAGAAAHRSIAERTRIELPAVRGVDVYRLFVDDTPVRLRVTAGRTSVPLTVTRDAVTEDVSLWRRLEVADWDTLPQPLREEGLEALLDRYRPVLASPRAWDRMSAHDWDAVPAPVRALAFRHMLQYWTGYYHVGRRHGLEPPLMADTAAAIVLSESWFDHRAEHVNPWGNRDIGLAQASGFARDRMPELYASGASDIVPEEEEYFNPWVATRFVAIWLAHVLDEVDGDLHTAIRAYHRGVRNARNGEGEEYLGAVLRRRRMYIQHPQASGAWWFLWRRDREITRDAWPWLRTWRPSPPGGTGAVIPGEGLGNPREQTPGGGVI